MRPSASRVRFALVGILALLALGFALPTAYCQFGRPPVPTPGRPPMPGRPPTPGRPPGGIGGITGMPGGISGIHGGISGMPGGISGGIGGISGGISGISGIGGGITTVWRCNRCGYTQNSPGFCPRCSVGGVGSGFGSSSGSVRPPASSPPPEMPELAVNPAYNSNSSTSSPVKPQPFAPPASSSDAEDQQIAPSSSGSSSSSSSSDDDTSRMLKIGGLVVATLFFLMILTMLIVVVSNSSGSRPARARRGPRGRRDPLDLYD